MRTGTILHCKDSSAMDTVRSLKMVDPAVELVCLISCQHLVELFSSLMEKYYTLLVVIGLVGEVGFDDY